MELGFSVSRAGPLSQISVQLLTLDTAVHLATGAYGWWKARERSASFADLIAIDGGHLVSTSSFNLVQYTYNRRQGLVQGSFVQDGRLQLVDLPKASTAVPDDAGLACLRALTTGLLCIYSIEATVTILTDLIPYGLMQFHQENSEFRIEGPVLSSLRLFVEAIAVEEDSNSFRLLLLNHVASEQSALFRSANAITIQQRTPSQAADVPFAIGMLKWMLTPVHKRTTPVYPTRSLQVWSLAVLMKRLGFAIEAASEPINTAADYAEACLDSVSQRPDVILNTGIFGETDTLAGAYAPQRPLLLKPQITPVRGIPWLAFRHLRNACDMVNTEYLVDVWNYAFSQAQLATVNIVPNGPNRSESVFLPLRRETSGFSPSEFHINLMSFWSPHLITVCYNAMQQFVPRSEDADSWALDKLQTAFQNYADGGDGERAPPSFYIIQAISLGTIYGIICGCLVDNEQPFGKDSHIAFQLEMMSRGRLVHLTNAVGRGLKGLLSYNDLVAVIGEMVLGINLLDGRTPVRTANQFQARKVLGLQASGLTVVSEIGVRPSAESLALYRFHVCSGQVLNLPLTEDGFIELSTRREPVSNVWRQPQDPLQTLHHFDEGMPDLNLRVDVEPCWEDDPRQVIFRVRKRGVVVCPLSTNLLFSRLEEFPSAHCACDNPVREVDVSQQPGSNWQPLSLETLIPSGYGLLADLASHRKELRRDEKVLIDAKDCAAAQLFVLGTLECQNLIISKGCLLCAWSKYQKLPERQRQQAAIFLMK